VRCRIEHIFGVMKSRCRDEVLRTIGMARAGFWIGLRNLTYNMSRLVSLKRPKTRRDRPVLGIKHSSESPLSSSSCQSCLGIFRRKPYRRALYALEQRLEKNAKLPQRRQKPEKQVLISPTVGDALLGRDKQKTTRRHRMCKDKG